MSEPIFNGNCYLFFPCIIDSLTHQDFMIEKTSEDEYISAFDKCYEIEINSKIHTELKRIYLDGLSFIYSDKKECTTEDSITGKVYLTYHYPTRLAVIAIAFFKAKIPITHLLENVSLNSIEILNDSKKINFFEFLDQKYNLKMVGKGKVCLTIKSDAVDDELFPYLMANETFGSCVMSANLRKEKFGKNEFKNIAQYDSSEIYAGRNTILRVDRRNNEAKTAVESDVIFLFILEVLIFKESSLGSINTKLLDYLSGSKNIPLKEFSTLIDSFGKTISFWDLEIFNFITAQNLVEEIEKSFSVDKKYITYKKNLDYFQHAIGVKRTLINERESRILFYLAIIIFSFEIYNLLKDFFDKNSSLSISGGSIFLCLVFFYFYNRKNK